MDSSVARRSGTRPDTTHHSTLLARISPAFAATPLDTTSLPQNSLDITERKRTNPLPWIGQFSPQLVEVLLTDDTPSGGTVLDPFAGSGTTLVEAARLGLDACAVELNPAPMLMARLYELINLEPIARRAALEEQRERLLESIGPPRARENGPTPSRNTLGDTLVQLWRQAPTDTTQSLAAALVVLCDLHRTHLGTDTIHKAWQRIEHTVRDLPEPASTIRVHHADARALPIESDSIDRVLTSPPYLNVHNYHQKHRKSVEAMGWDALRIARSEIGSNRRNRKNRFLTVIQYALDMTLALREMQRTTRDGAALILVLGRESSVRGTPFFNGPLVAELAVRGLGLTIERRQERLFRNRYGTDIHEDILHLQANGTIIDEGSALKTARHIAENTLRIAQPLTPPKERTGLDDAIANIDAVMPSPPSPITSNTAQRGTNPWEQSGYRLEKTGGSCRSIPT